MAVPDVATLLEQLHESAPLVHCITNSVVTNFSANVLLAAGAAPAMVDIVGEAGAFAQVAGGLLVNLGTPNPEQREAAREAVGAAVRAGTPWVLDPVAIGSLPIRTSLAMELAGRQPAAVRGNASEILALAGAGAGGRGVEATDSTDRAVRVAARLARELGTVIAVSGPEDVITDGHSGHRVTNGHLLLTKVTGGGCALGALVAAFLAVRGEHSVLAAVTAAHTVYGIAAENAADGASGPGTFAARLLDRLSTVTPADVTALARVREADAGDDLA
ncbi:hydroxyethylthiazole kinase [Ruania albidiflava]|uniref:hydroxyethylthiazole kinase n=1 Tax=Ruania albidiflava TaxID=366586 RepID=UPI0023F267E3|nr:hydroxyethylthiazole kinase [Ruania albidiflava]